VFASPYFRRFALISVTSHATFVSLQSLWAGPWFVQVLGLSPLESAQVLFVFNLVLLCGYLNSGWLMPRLEARGIGMDRVILVGTLLVILVELAIASTQATWAWGLWLVLAIVSTFYTTVQTHVSLSFPAAVTGRAYTAYNLLIFSGMFLAQWLFGVVIDLYKAVGADTPHAFRYTLATWAAMQLLALVTFVIWKVPPPAAGHAGAEG
jgi:hypothetical protein